MNKQLNKQVSDLIKAQDEANKALTVRSQFLARISHELRTPLAGIIGATTLVLDEPLTDAGRELIEMANESSHVLLGVVNDLLDFETIERHELKIEPGAFDLPLAIKSALEPVMMRAQAKAISFRLQIAPETPYLVYSDRLRIQQVLVNLADNATKFTEQGGVTVEVTVEEKNSAQAVIRFTVSDTGMGIDSDLLDQIWEPFSQGDGFSARKHGGTGLGLPISKKLVEILHGQIGVKSVPDKGSEFFFKIPLSLRQAADNIPEPQEKTRAVAQGSRILVVDDNLTICKVSEAQLKALGCQVECAITGQAALELTKKKHFDLILMDMQMPGMDGIQTSEAIRRAQDNPCRDVPIIAYTAHAMPGDERRFLAAGLSGYLAKPVMVDAMRKLLEKWVRLPAQGGHEESNEHEHEEKKAQPQGI
jgi:CheY-like chemotaxis protein